MPLNEKALKARHAERDIGAELLQALRDGKSDKVGPVNMVDVPLATQARMKLGMSQGQFAAFIGVSVRIFQDCEQGRRQLPGRAEMLLRVAAVRPMPSTRRWLLQRGRGG